MKNINSTNKGRDLLVLNKPRIVSQGAERVPQRIQRHVWVTLHRSTHIKWEKNQIEKYSYGLDWIQKGIWYGSAKLDYKLPQNVQNIRWSHKVYRENHENLESGIDSRRKKLSWNKNPKRYISRRCTIILTIHNCHDANKYIFRKFTAGYKLSRSQKINQKKGNLQVLGILEADTIKQ